MTGVSIPTLHAIASAFHFNMVSPWTGRALVAPTPPLLPAARTDCLQRHDVDPIAAGILDHQSPGLHLVALMDKIENTDQPERLGSIWGRLDFPAILSSGCLRTAHPRRLGRLGQRPRLVGPLQTADDLDQRSR